ncbi:MAG TPA: Yip1 family protein [Puia sp.]|nr:Yip1 family protein [Puia sp.]
MSLFARVRQMLFHPVTEWRSIGGEKGTMRSVLVGYVLPMALIPAVCSFVGYGFVGADGLLFRVSGLYWGTSMAIDSLITSLSVYLLGTWLVDRMAPAFGGKRDLGRSAQLVAYAYTPAWLAGIFYLLPTVQELVVLGLYGVYLFYLGIPIMKRMPDNQRIAFTISSAIILIIIRFVVGLVIVNIVYIISRNPYLPFTFLAPEGG